MGKSSINGPFPMAMLNNQRVVSWDDSSQLNEKIKNVPNHQADIMRI